MDNLDKFKSNGKFLMLALDHRGSIKKLINPGNPDAVTDEVVVQLKSEIIQGLADQFSGVLIDETFGLDACKEVCSIKPFLLPLEKSSHTGLTELEYSVEDLKSYGATGAKILIDFDPDSENVSKQLETAKKAAEEARVADFPLFLEIVTHSPDKVLESLQMFLDFGVEPDVWKLEFPGSFENCQQITGMVGKTPWILLTGGNSFEEFSTELQKAITGGAKGFLAGRALWQEVCKLEGEEKKKFLETTLPERFKEIAAVAI
jgi:sulfofructosephosphate aldolase